MDIFRIKDDDLEDADSVAALDTFAAEIVKTLQDTLRRFQEVAAKPSWSGAIRDLQRPLATSPQLGDFSHYSEAFMRQAGRDGLFRLH